MRVREASLDGRDIRAEIAADGYVVLGGIPLSEPRKRLAEILSRFGVPNLEDVSDVKPEPNGRPLSTKGMAHFGLHTDMALYPNPPEHIGMLCLSKDRQGGESLLADARDGIARLSDAERDALRTTDLRFPAPASLRRSHGDTVNIRVLDALGRADGDHEILRYRYGIDQMDLPEPMRAALLSLRSSFERTLLRFPLIPGQAVIFNNEWMLHGRTEIVPDPGDATSKRHLIRMYA